MSGRPPRGRRRCPLAVPSSLVVRLPPAGRVAVGLVATALVAAALVAAGCQGMDRVERPPEVAAGDDEAVGAAADRATRLRRGGDVSTLGEADGSPGRLTVAVATRRLAEIESVRGQERLERIDALVDAYPRAEGLSRLWVLAGEAQQDLERHDRAAEAFERAVALTGTDLLGLPHEPDLAYRVGWARFQAGDRQRGLDWLVRTTFISAHPRVEQALRFFRAERGRQEQEARAGGDPSGTGIEDFDAWLRRQRAELAVAAPDFELPGFQRDTFRSSELPGRVRVVNFWTPT